MFLLLPFTKIAKIVPLSRTKWPPELKIEKKLNISSLASGLISKFHKIFLLVLWKFQRFNFLSKISQKLFKPLPWNLTADREWWVNDLIKQLTQMRVVAHGPLVFWGFFCPSFTCNTMRKLHLHMLSKITVIAMAAGMRALSTFWCTCNLFLNEFL